MKIEQGGDGVKIVSFTMHLPAAFYNFEAYDVATGEGFGMFFDEATGPGLVECLKKTYPGGAFAVRPLTSPVLGIEARDVEVTTLKFETMPAVPMIDAAVLVNRAGK
jgi:hypothetical protein